MTTFKKSYDDIMHDVYEIIKGTDYFKYEEPYIASLAHYSINIAITEIKKGVIYYEYMNDDKTNCCSCRDYSEIDDYHLCNIADDICKELLDTL